MVLPTVNSGPPDLTKSRTFILWNQSTRKTQILMGGRFGSIQAGVGFLDNSVRPPGTGGEVGAVGTSVSGNLAPNPARPSGAELDEPG